MSILFWFVPFIIKSSHTASVLKLCIEKRMQNFHRTMEIFIGIPVSKPAIPVQPEGNGGSSRICSGKGETTKCVRPTPLECVSGPKSPRGDP